MTAPPRVDAHHHLWDPGRRAYPWMTDDVAALRRRFDLGDYRRAAGPRPRRSVVVQAVGSLEETADLLATAAAHDEVAAVVGWVDLQGDVPRQLRLLQAGAGGDRLRGVRHQVHDEDDPQWLLRPAVQAGLEQVAAAGLAFDLLVRERELPAAIETAARQPWLRLVLDHAGKPDPGGDLRRWTTLLHDLAAAPHVACKLSGLVTEADALESPRFAEIAGTVLDAFGPDRVMLGSDWPVCTLVGDLAAVEALHDHLVGHLPPDDRDALVRGTATTWYRLDDTAAPTRHGSVIRLDESRRREYELLHVQVWPRVVAALRREGIRNYSIFERDGTLFASFEYSGTDLQASLARIAQDETTRRWWQLTDPCQQPLPTAAPGERWAPARLLFHED